MELDILTSDIDELSLALDELSAEITTLPEKYRNRLAHHLQQLHDCLQDQAYQKLRGKFAKAFRSSPAALAICRVSDGLFVDVNESFCSAVGFARAEIVGHTVLELGLFVEPEEGLKLREIIRQQDSVRNYEIKSRARTGNILTMLFSVERFDMDGEPYVLATGIDITERKWMEESLRESERALRASMLSERARANELEALMDAVPAMIWVSHDPQCREMVGNRAGLEILREKPGANVSSTASEEVRAQQSYRSMKDGRGIPTTELPMQVAAATGKPTRNYTYDIVFDDGTTYSLIGNVNPLFDAEGKLAGAVGAFVDITALRRLEAERVESIAEIEVQRRLIEQREQERQQIARDIHDGPIQTLVSTIFNLQVTKEALPDRQIQIELNQIGISIKNSVQELRQVVNELRPPSILRFGLSRAILIHAEDIRERHPELDLHLDMDSETARLAEPISLTLFRIYQEALNNIIRHAEATRADVRLTFQGEKVLLEVKDNGKGFTARPDLVKQIERGHYGMAGMKERAKALNGRLEIQSEPGQGTTVRVTLPLEI